MSATGENKNILPINMDKVNLLDHGFIRLIGKMGDDLSVVRSARVSYDAAWRAGEDEDSDTKLINYLWKNRHTTPFESVTFTFEIMAPIFVFRQWHRHRTQSYNELSARYKPLPRKFYLPDPALVGQQAKHNKQMREITDLTHQELAARKGEVKQLQWACDAAFNLYDALMEAGWPRELARSVLPMNTYSHMFCTGNLLNFLKFLTLRDDPHAQHEIRVYAEAMRELMRPIVPVVMAAFEKARLPKDDQKDKWAEGILEQFADKHEGAASWLLNYGKGEKAAKLKADWQVKSGKIIV